jgi:hypothetical protein
VRLQQFEWLNSEAGSKATDAIDGRPGLAAFQLTDEGPVKSAIYC